MGTQIADVIDENVNTGWAYWQFKKYKDLTTAAGNHSEGFYNMDGTLQLDKIKAISRTYVQSAQGTVIAQKFFQNGTFTTSIKVNDTSASTEIYVNDAGKGVMWYPKGLTL